jgi:hypothetical protein
VFGKVLAKRPDDAAADFAGLSTAWGPGWRHRGAGRPRQIATARARRWNRRTRAGPMTPPPTPRSRLSPRPAAWRHPRCAPARRCRRALPAAGPRHRRLARRRRSPALRSDGIRPPARRSPPTPPEDRGAAAAHSARAHAGLTVLPWVPAVPPRGHAEAAVPDGGHGPSQCGDRRAGCRPA